MYTLSRREPSPLSPESGPGRTLFSVDWARHGETGSPMAFQDPNPPITSPAWENPIWTSARGQNEE
jgi:hypothetical protein